jgi:predicted nucleic acid-binding protein
VNKSAVINASPLIIMSRGGFTDLLRCFADEITVPRPVADEISARGSDDITLRTVREKSWIHLDRTRVVIPEIIAAWGLGIGESSVLAYALAHPGAEAIIDDLQGRKCASNLNIPVRGTLGIVLSAKKRGVIPQARPVIEKLLMSGLYLSRYVIDTALKKVGE